MENFELTTNKAELAEFVKLRTGFKPVKLINDIDLKKECANIITRAFTYSTPNGVTSPEILQHQTNELFLALKGRYKDLTIPEIQMAFKKGLDGEFGAYFGMCGKTYAQFLKCFFELPQRGRQWLDYLDSLDIKIADKPSVVNPEKDKDGLIRYFEEYKKTGKFGYFPYVYYDLIKKVKGVNSLITLEQFKEIKAKTEAQFLQRYIDEKKKAERRGDFKTSEGIGSLLAKGIEKDLTLINRQKELALKTYFDGINELDI